MKKKPIWRVEQARQNFNRGKVACNVCVGKGAQPQPGEFGWYAWLLLLVPILIGGYGAQRALARLPRLAELRKKAGVVAVSIVGAALLIGLVDGAAGGALGDGRLSSVGAPALSMAFMAMLLMGMGASVVVLRDWWKFAR